MSSQFKYNYDFWSYDKDLMAEFNWFLRKVNQRAYINQGFITESYDNLRRDGSQCFGLGADVEYFHPTITLDDRMRFIGTEIASADMSMINIVGNTFISHFYGARGIHWLLSGKEGEFVDFDKVANNDKDYIQFLKDNVAIAQKNKQPIWGTTELHTSIQTAGRNYCREKYNLPDKQFDTVDVCEWVSSFRDNGIIEGMLKCKHLSEIYKLLTSQNGIGGYYGFHGSTSSSALPQVEYHHDQRFVVAGPGAQWTIKKLWPGIPNKNINEAVYFLRENAEEIGLVDGIEFHKDAYNIAIEDGPFKGRDLFEFNQDSLKYYGTEVACCQFSVYMQIRDDEKRCEKRKVARATKQPASTSLEDFFE